MGYIVSQTHEKGASMELAGSKTEQNLQTAFAGESQAHTK